MIATVGLIHYVPSLNSLLGKNEEVREDSLTISGKYGQNMITQNQAKHQKSCHSSLFE